MTKVKLFWLGVSVAAIAAGGSVWIDTDAPTPDPVAETPVEKRDCGLTLVPEHIKEKLRPECL